MLRSPVIVVPLVVLMLVAGCGGSSQKSGSSTAPSAEAQSAATGDIPDSQVFLAFRNRAAGYSIKYPEGWAKIGSGNDVTFRDKDNVVHIVVAKGRPPASASRVGHPSKTTFTRPGAPNPVTGKRLQLMVDRYVFARAGKVATIDLSTPKGVDNVDAYRMMSRSFRWQ
jgi:plastocyanin